MKKLKRIIACQSHENRNGFYSFFLFVLRKKHYFVLYFKIPFLLFAMKKVLIKLICSERSLCKDVGRTNENKLIVKQSRMVIFYWLALTQTNSFNFRINFGIRFDSFLFYFQMSLKVISKLNRF
jgi:hypothetical protein